ncbi:MAG: acyloxyacyl hydrolase, partial [Deltaproteobacteria bacterium]|nr:acyloxyacyl hydrolase [Deltaproteobacteria bacterium]
MRSKRGNVIAGLMIVGVLFLPWMSLAEDAGTPLAKGTKEIGFSTGYGFSDGAERYVESLPITVHWGYVFTEPKGSSFFRGNLEFLAEGRFSYLLHDRHQYGVEVAGLIRYNFLAGGCLVPYLQGGVGVLHSNLDMHNFPNDFNFSPQLGVGIQYFINRSMAIRGEYRSIHYSNAG